jgi:MtN3 and saliva related transmembrane protein
MEQGEVIGFIAGILTTAANVPQVVTTYKRRSGEGLSFRMLAALGAGLLLWVAYGLVNRSLPIILSNAAGAGLVATLLAMKVRFDRRPAKD